MKEKFCKTCGKTKSVKEFHRHARIRDGYQSRCADCTRKLRKKDSKVCFDISSLDPAKKMNKEDFLNWYNNFDKDLLEKNRYSLARRD
jgi:hypothetical protein